MLTMSYNAATKSLVCAFSGHMDSANCDEAARQLTAKIAELAPAGGGKVHAVAPGLKIAFDLQAVEYVSSVFLRVVLATAKRVEKGAFAIAKCQTAVRDLLKTAGMEQWLAQDEGIESLMRETRVFPPPAEFAAAARVKSLEEYRALHAASVADPETFWAGRARELVQWMRPFDKTLEWKPPNAKWFLGGQLNVSANCLDRHLATDVADKPAIVWEGERALEGLPGESRTLTYRQLHREVCRFANVLRSLGAGKGSRVLIYLPMVPEAAVAMLACARVGAIHSVVFGGFSSSAVAERAKDCGAKIIVTADGGFRRGAVTPLKRNVDDALGLKDENGKLYCAAVEEVVVLRRTGCPVEMQPGRDVWWHDEMVQAPEDCPAEVMDSEDTLFILYTSGSTGKPKGIYHSSAGYLLGAALSFQMVFDAKPSDVYWCTADVGWITGHTYVVYGPLASGATVLIYEGAPNYPDNSRFWNIVERHKVTIFYTAPTAIRSFMQWGNQWIEKHDLSSLRLLGTVGEPINPQAWIWYHDTIGRGRLPIVDTWWQTETGSIMIAPLPGATPLKPGSATLPFFGIQAEVVDDKGQAVAPGMGGRLVIRKPWPSMLRGVWGDPQRFEWTYWRDVPGSYCTGDGARRDKDGYLWIVGRIDDVLKVSGHRIGTAELESALVSHPAVAEAAVVGRADDVKGEAIVAFVTVKAGVEATPKLREELRQHVGREIGPVAKPEEIRFAQLLPKTRSGKIMRRLLRQVAAGSVITGDVTTLEDFSVLAKLCESAE